MLVTDRQLAALRAQLAGELDRHRDLFGRLDWSVDHEGYVMLQDAAFFEAATRRFGPRASISDITSYVAGIRARSSRAAADVDPEVAGQLIAAAIGRGSLRGVDLRVMIRARLYLLVALVMDAGYDDAGLDEFLGEARKIADEWLYSSDEPAAGPKLLDSVRTTVAVKSLFDGRTIPAGMQGAIVELLPDGACLVELAFRPQTASQDGDFALAELAEGQYEILRLL